MVKARSQSVVSARLFSDSSVWVPRQSWLKSELELCWPGIPVWLGRVLLLEGNCPLALTVLALRADTASHS